MTRYVLAAGLSSLALLLGCRSESVPLPGLFPPPDPGTDQSIENDPGMAQPAEAATHYPYSFSQVLQAAAAKEVVGRWSGYVVGVLDQGRFVLLRGFGTVAEDHLEALTPEHVFPFPALTEVLVGVLAGAFHERGVLDMDAPLSAYLTPLSPGLGRIRLRQLLTHTSGLDNAAPPEEEEWDEILDDLDDRALFTEPGAIYSYSWYSYPLAIRVLEGAAGVSFEEAVETAIFRPLEMDRSTFDPDVAANSGLVLGNDLSADPILDPQVTDIETEWLGLPILFTTSREVLTLLAAWMNGGIRGSRPLEVVPLGTPSIPRSRGSFGGGVWMDEFEGIPRVYRIRSATSARFASPPGSGVRAGFHLFPHSRSAVLIWGIGRVPRITSSLVLNTLHQMISYRGDVGTPTPDLPEGSASTLSTETVLQREWIGRYVNGEYYVELRDSGDGFTFFSSEGEMEAVSIGNGEMEARTPEGRKAFGFLLLRDSSERRYVILPDRFGNDRAYLHEEDREGKERSEAEDRRFNGVARWQDSPGGFGDLPDSPPHREGREAG